MRATRSAVLLMNATIAFGSPFSSFCSELPIIVLSTEKYGPVSPSNGWDDRFLATMKVYDNGGNNCLTNSPTRESGAGIKIRGRSTLTLAKKQWSVKVYGSLSQQDLDAWQVNKTLPSKEDYAMLGLNPGDKWVFGAPFVDLSYAHNVVGYQLAQPLQVWAPSTEYFELFLLTAGKAAFEAESYQGLMILTESIDRGSTRIPINKLKPDEVTYPDVSGGYIFAVDAPDPEDRVLQVQGPIGSTTILKYPDPEDVQDEQVTYLEDSIQVWQDYLTGKKCSVVGVPTGTKCNAQGGSTLQATPDEFSDFIDLTSFAEYLLHTEMSKNQDGYANSVYFHKYKDVPPTTGLIVAGPVWDLNMAYGLPSDDNLKSPEGWLFSIKGQSLWKKLLKSSALSDIAVERYRALRAGPWSTATLHGAIEAIRTRLSSSGAAKRDYERWFSGVPKMDAELDGMKAFLAARLDWMDTHICSLHAEFEDGTSVRKPDDPSDCHCDALVFAGQRYCDCSRDTCPGQPPGGCGSTGECVCGRDSGKGGSFCFSTPTGGTPPPTNPSYSPTHSPSPATSPPPSLPTPPTASPPPTRAPEPGFGWDCQGPYDMALFPECQERVKWVVEFGNVDTSCEAQEKVALEPGNKCPLPQTRSPTPVPSPPTISPTASPSSPASSPAPTPTSAAPSFPSAGAPSRPPSPPSDAAGTGGDAGAVEESASVFVILLVAIPSGTLFLIVVWRCWKKLHQKRLFQAGINTKGWKNSLYIESTGSFNIRDLRASNDSDNPYVAMDDLSPGLLSGDGGSGGRGSGAAHDSGTLWHV